MIDPNTPKMDKDTFRFVMPADLEKGADGSYKVSGLASTERVDQQGETIIQKGIDLTPIDKKKGILNWDHAKGPENTIGILDGYQRTAKGLHIEGRLFKNHTKAKAVREIMESLAEGDKGRIGLSVEGKILERDPLNPSIIKKCQISAVALTMNPVNTDTFADIVKSMNAAEGLDISSEEQPSSAEEAVFTASQVVAMVQKALAISASQAVGAPEAKTDGAALQPSDMKAKPKKKKMKKMEKDMYKSNLLTVLDKLQVLYPHHSRSEIWEAVRDRLDTTYEIVKGGAGSGIKGHVTLKDQVKHDQMTHAAKHGLLDKLQGAAKHFQDQYVAAKRSGSKEHIEHYKKLRNESHGHLMNRLDAGTRDMKKSDDEIALEIEKAIRIKNTSGKEREHKLYEEARQRDDYESNKDKSRAELHALAEQSGAGKHDKAKIRAQADAAQQVGDRDHVRPNVAG